MRENFEIEKELKFKSNIAEVTSISLEEKHDIKDNKLEGNFVVSGEYKIHEISLNKEKFSFKIPYECAIKNDIESETVNVEVTNFIYDTDNDSLFVTINYDINGDRKDILLFDDEENLEEFLKSREVEIIMDDVIDEIDKVQDKKEKKEIDIPILKDEVMYELNELKEKELVVDEVVEDKEVLRTKSDDKDCGVVDFQRNVENAKQELLNSVNVNDDNYITYKIHIVKSEDTMESILTKYDMSIDELKEYNEINTLQLGDKLIIPIVDEKY